MREKVVFFLLFLSFSLEGFTQGEHERELDQKLARYVRMFRFAPIKPLSRRHLTLYELGKKLFQDRRLSLKNNISCQDCHHPALGTGDGVPLAIGTGGHYQKGKRRLLKGKIGPRNTPPLYNKGHKEFQTMFWDQRIFYNDFDKSFTTPDEGLNGQNPKYKEIAQTLSGPLAAQALFPLVNPQEMLGQQPFLKTNDYYWSKITNRLLKNRTYQAYFKKLWPGKRINIAHIANAIAYFESRAFEVSNTPWDQYLRGDKKAMSFDEKRGAIAFIEKGRCARCHSGKHLTNFTMHNIGIPSIGPGVSEKGKDFGRYEVFKDKIFLFAFVTPPLRNIAKTAPYFHNGTMTTLKDVILHYDNTMGGFEDFTGEKLQKYNLENYNGKLSQIKDPKYLSLQYRTISPPVRVPLMLTEEDVALIELFLKKSLSGVTAFERESL